MKKIMCKGEIDAINKIFGTELSANDKFDDFTFVSPSYIKAIKEKRSGNVKETNILD